MWSPASSSESMRDDQWCAGKREGYSFLILVLVVTKDVIIALSYRWYSGTRERNIVSGEGYWYIESLSVQSKWDVIQNKVTNIILQSDEKERVRELVSMEDEGGVYKSETELDEGKK